MTDEVYGGVPGKPNCYECKWRRSIPGDAHSRCGHPEVKTSTNTMGALVDMLQGKAVEATEKLGIRGDPIGIKHGWFMWPANFDPVWLITCKGFTPKEAKEDEG